MELSNLVKTTKKTKKRVGRGHGSGKGGHTVGRGRSGQKSRGKVPLIFEGTKIKKSLLKRLPLLRGKGKFKSYKPSKIVINLKYLNFFKTGEIVNLETLIKKGIVNREDTLFGVKILGDGELAIPLKVQLPVSKGARAKIEKAGGSVEMPLIEAKKETIKVRESLKIIGKTKSKIPTKKE